ncbi:addiction module protein [Aliifodinibius salipaludis]|uniref:addiction module protein n=1 Tax=Fodinibius salipaludis TaxID=2032627 RepID=UPI003314116D
MSSILARTLEPDPEIEQEWVDEIKRREKEIKAGTTKMISQEEFEQHLKELRELYQKGKKENRS